MADINRTTGDNTLYDENGNPVAIVQDGGIYRLSTKALTNENVISKDATFDAFNRKRVSQIQTLIDVRFLNDKNPLFVDEETNGSGSATYNSSESSITLSTSSSGDYVVRQTFQRTNYQSGKSHQILMTGYGLNTQSNIIKRLGYFSSATTGSFNTGLDGLFFESSSGSISVNVYRSGTEIESIPQSSWNLDTLDGNGESGINIDWSQNQIFIIDFQWLGVGRVRWGVIVGGTIKYFHESNFSNSSTKVYMQYPNQPLRWEIRQTGAGAGSFTKICATVGTEGSINKIGIERSDYSGQVDANSTGTTYGILGIRFNSSELNTVTELVGFSMIATSLDNYIWKILLNPTVAGTFTYSDVPNSPIQSASGATANTISGGILIASGFGTEGEAQTFITDSALKLGSQIDGTTNEIVLCVEPLSSSLDFYGSITWRELI